MKKTAVILAGGSGTRMGKNLPKQFLLLDNKPILFHTLETFLDAYDDLEIVLVLPEDHLAHWKNQLPASWLSRIKFTTGGATRYASVQNGLKLAGDEGVIFVHDGVRCMVSKELIHRCYEETLKYGSAIPAITPVDSMRMITPDGSKIVNRDHLRIIQTPQTFLAEVLLKAFEQEYEESFTDEAGVVEKMGEQVHLIEGEWTNLKITQPIDLEIALAILKWKSNPEGL